MPIFTNTDEFIQLLQTNGIYSECELSQHPDKCCDTISTTVLNFDKISEMFYTKLNLTKLSSADALYISKDKKKLYFIEMKSKSSTRSIQKWVTKYLRAGEIPKQIIESVLTLVGIFGWHNCHNGFYSYFLNSTDAKIHAVFLCNCSDRELVGLRTMNLQHRSFKYTNVVGKFEWYNCESIKEFFANN